jgi:serine/threonine-protein kinase
MLTGLAVQGAMMRTSLAILLACASACTGNITTSAGLPATGDNDASFADAVASPDADPGMPPHADAAPGMHPDAATPPPPGPDAAPPTAPPGAYFPAGAPWYTDVSDAPVDPQSNAVIAYLDGFGWATNNILQIDFGIEVLDAPAGTPTRTFVPTSDWGAPDCDMVPVPIPAGGALEGESGYACTTDGDCHLIVADRVAHKLYEMWRANISGGVFHGGCLAVWDMTRVYGPKGRGEQCTSADAAGYPIAPLLFNADEVAAGEIPHAIRFILPNAHIRDGQYVHPATHGTLSASGPMQAPPYGAHLRLKASFDESTLPSEGARVVARALKKYGMFLADGGNVPLTAQSDRFTTHKWNGLLDARDLQGITPGDFELLEMPAPTTLTLDCVREP